MRKVIEIVIVVISTLLCGVTHATADRRTEFIQQVNIGAQQNWQAHQILPSVTIAQAILESGWGTSELTVVANNLFGIKGEPTVGDTIAMPTREVIMGHSQMIWASFRKYGSLADSIRDHGQFLSTNLRYRNVLGEKIPERAAEKLHQDGYATDPNYASELMQIIHDNNLVQMDNVSQQDRQNVLKHDVVQQKPIWDAQIDNRPYIIQPGDNWWRISQASDVTMLAVSQASHSPIRWWIYPGQQLTVPNNRTYVVQKGDTWQRIEQGWQVATGTLAKINQRENGEAPRVGERIKLTGNDRSA